jgi:hypothetical protein
MRSPPPHLAAALAAADVAHEIEPGIWRADGADAGIAQYDTIGAAYDFIGGLDVYHRLFWGVSTREYRTFVEAAMAAHGRGALLDCACGSMLFTAQALENAQLTRSFGWHGKTHAGVIRVSLAS